MRQDSRFPRLGGLLYATISLKIGILCPELFDRFLSFLASDGVAMVLCQMAWICDERGFEGWKGKWKNSALFDLSVVLPIMVIVFSCATWSCALISALARSGRMVVDE